jgi:hypothetical protein
VSEFDDEEDLHRAVLEIVDDGLALVDSALRPGDPVTVLERKSARAVYAWADVLLHRTRGRPLILRFNNDGKPIVELFWGWVDDRRVRALLPSQEGLNWCRGHIDGSALEATWKLVRSIAR